MSCGCQNAKTDEFCPDAPEEAGDPIAEVTTSQPLHRRTLLKAAALWPPSPAARGSRPPQCWLTT